VAAPVPFPSEHLPVALPLPQEGVELWWCRTEADDAAADIFATWIASDERQRARRFASAALARRYVVGRATLRFVLGARLRLAPAAVTIARGPRGRPRLASGAAVDFNVSNTRGVMLIGITTRPGVRIGADVEHSDRKLDHRRLARKFCTPFEAQALGSLDDDAHRRRFLRLWTCKEAMSKATGDGIGAPLRHLSVALEPEPALVDGPSPYEPARWRLLAAPVPADYVATVALWDAAGTATERFTR
jgi:4'-phosphopantetheinyl transferase